MYINATGFYLPEQRIPNSFYTERAGLTDDWIVQRTGIKTRARAQANENINTMGLEAVRNALPWLPYDKTSSWLPRIHRTTPSAQPLMSYSTPMELRMPKHSPSRRPVRRS